MYTKPVGATCRKHQLQHHFYVDDSQLYLAFKPTEKTATNDTFQRIEACLNDIVGWMNQHFLKPNTDKTEVIMFNLKRKLLPTGNLSIQVGDSCIKPSLNVRFLGAIFDTHPDMEHHVNAVSRTCYTQIRNISKIRLYLTTDATCQLHLNIKT